MGGIKEYAPSWSKGKLPLSGGLGLCFFWLGFMNGRGRLPTWKSMARRHWECSADIRIDAMDVDNEREKRWLHDTKPLPVRHSFNWTDLPSRLKDVKIPSWVEDIKRERKTQGVKHVIYPDAFA